MNPEVCFDFPGHLGDEMPEEPPRALLEEDEE